MDFKRDIVRLAKVLTADYVWDPEHKNKPKGPGWDRTLSGWSNVKSETKPKKETIPSVKTPKKNIPEISIKPKPVAKPKNPSRDLLTSLLYEAESKGLVSKDAEGKAVVEQKDIDRIFSIVNKAKGSPDKARMYVENMSNAITNKQKAIRRGLAAFHGLKNEFGNEFAWEMASIFVKKGLSL